MHKSLKVDKFSCFACLGVEDLTENVTENTFILQNIKSTFNLEIKIYEGFPTFFCLACQVKLNQAVEFFKQIKENLKSICELDSVSKLEEPKIEEIDLNVKLEDADLNTACPTNRVQFNNVDSTKSSTNDIEGDDEEPLINWLFKSKRNRVRKKVKFNPKLKKVSLPMIEKAIKEYKEKCKVNSNCILCDFKGLNIRNLSCHMLFKHKEEKNRWCLRCNTLVENLGKHKKSHTSRIWCKFCKKDITKCHFMEHLKAHSGTNLSYDGCCEKFQPQSTVIKHSSDCCQQKINIQGKNKEKPFRCHICIKSFKLIKNLEEHVLSHGRYKCQKCQKNFEIPELLASHFCSDQSLFKEEDDLNRSVVPKEERKGDIVLTETSNVCRTTDNIEETKQHNNNNSSTKNMFQKPEIQIESLTCHFCQRTYKTPYKLQKHIEAHMGIFIARCKYCEKGFSSKADLATHERVHTKEKPFICNACGKGFVSGTTLRVHMKQHTGKPEECELCHKKFCRKSELKLHLQKHRGERPFLCTDCGMSFAQKSHLTCHLTQHSEDRPFSCVLCEKSFKKKALLKHHMALHGEKKFKCSVCFYECHRKYRLQQHMKLHSDKSIKEDSKLNACQLCTRSFSTVQLLNVHMSKTHNVII
ncbi:hypothetical protein ABEB36_006438 [Hypothenemus hampei]|uniref:Uncharacterized protein n=1 Tax=Hypothenemus hampei TaxID=57062 RepID=A0ABD1EQI0_HYPHA